MTARTVLPKQPFFTPREVADILRINYRTVGKWLKDEEHPLVGIQLNNGIWRIPYDNFLKYLEECYGQQ